MKDQPTPLAVTITHVRPTDIRNGIEYGNYCIAGNEGEPASYVFVNTNRNAIPAALRKVGQPGFISWDAKTGAINFIPAEFKQPDAPLPGYCHGTQATLF